jgi:hypothetical protein
LDFVLETGDRSISIDDQCSGQQGAIDDAFGAQNNCEARLRGDGRNGGPRAFEKGAVGRRHRLSLGSVARNVALRKTNDLYSLAGCLSDGLFGQCDRLLRACREPDVGECDRKAFTFAQH